MTDEERHERALASHRRWYREMKKDPERYAHYLAMHRFYQKRYDAKRRAQREEDWQEFRNAVNNGAKIWSDKTYE